MAAGVELDRRSTIVVPRKSNAHLQDRQSNTTIDEYYKGFHWTDNQ
jgi:hypothetical protein